MVGLLPLIVYGTAGYLTKEEFNNMPWDILMLIGGGLALGTGVRTQDSDTRESAPRCRIPPGGMSMHAPRGSILFRCFHSQRSGGSLPGRVLRAAGHDGHRQPLPALPSPPHGASPPAHGSIRSSKHCNGIGLTRALTVKAMRWHWTDESLDREGNAMAATLGPGGLSVVLLGFSAMVRSSLCSAVVCVGGGVGGGGGEVSATHTRSSSCSCSTTPPPSSRRPNRWR